MNIAEPPAHPRETLWTVTRGQRHRYAMAILAMALTNLFLFGAPLVGKYAIDVAVAADLTQAAPLLGDLNVWLSGPDGGAESIRNYLWLSALAALLITCIGGLFMYLRGRLAALASEAIVRRVRGRIYAHLHDLQARYYDTADTGDLVQRASSDVETLRVFLASDVIEIGRACMLVLCVIPLLFWLDSRLAWLSLILMPFLVVGAYVFFKRVQTVFQLTDESEAAMTATLQENLTGIRVVRAFARQDHEAAKFAQKNGEFRNNNYRLMRLMGLYWSISDFFAMSQIGIVLIAGAAFVLDGSLSVGTLFAFMTYESMVIWPVRQLGRVLTDSGKAVVSLGRINEVLDEAIEEEAPVPATDRVRGEIVISGLNFAYPAENSSPAVLQDINLRVAAGETIGIVGAPGSGKSSLLRVLLGLYPYTEGRVTLDGHEVSAVDRHWLRRQISVVLQDPFLYSGTIADNLRVGRLEASDAVMQDVCEQAALHSSIEGFTEGYATAIGERGVTLSGGQRQRLALARALLKDPPVLILDDALSAVDTRTESHILRALRARKGRQTTLIIAHRLSSVVHADRIVVLEHGRIEQIGNHEQLQRQPGTYQRLCELQGALDAAVAQDINNQAGDQQERDLQGNPV